MGSDLRLVRKREKDCHCLLKQIEEQRVEDIYIEITTAGHSKYPDMQKILDLVMELNRMYLSSSFLKKRSDIFGLLSNLRDYAGPQFEASDKRKANELQDLSFKIRLEAESIFLKLREFEGGSDDEVIPLLKRCETTSQSATVVTRAKVKSVDIRETLKLLNKFKKEKDNRRRKKRSASINPGKSNEADSKFPDKIAQQPQRWQLEKRKDVFEFEDESEEEIIPISKQRLLNNRQL